MSANPLLQVGLDLSEEILSTRLEVGIHDLREDWNQVAYFYLRQSHQALEAVSIILPRGLVTPSEVLVRYLFELAVRLKFMEESPEDRVPDFLSHSQLADPADDEFNRRIHALHEQGDYAAASRLMLPHRPWGNLKEMCEEVGLLDDYETVYRLSSEHAHGGGHGMAQDSLVAVGLDRIPDWEPSGVLHTAITYYALIVNINLKVFPYLASKFCISPDWERRMGKFGGDIRSMMRL